MIETENAVTKTSWPEQQLLFTCHTGEELAAKRAEDARRESKLAEEARLQEKAKQEESERLRGERESQERQEQQEKRVSLEKSCAGDQNACLELARYHVQNSSNAATTALAFGRVCPQKGEPVQDACGEAAEWAASASMFRAARAFLLKGCSENEGQCCGKLYLNDRKTGHRDTAVTLVRAIETLEQECDARMEISCQQLVAVLDACPKSNKQCKSGFLRMHKRLVDKADRTVRELEEKLRQQKEDADREADAALARSSADDAREAAEQARKEAESMRNEAAWNRAAQSINDTLSRSNAPLSKPSINCTSNRIGTTTFTNCR
jgi:hypothetical protein